MDLKSSATEFGNRKMCDLKFEDKKKFTYDISIFQQKKCKSSKDTLENHQVVILKKCLRKMKEKIKMSKTLSKNKFQKATVVHFTLKPAHWFALQCESLTWELSYKIKIKENENCAR